MNPEFSYNLGPAAAGKLRTRKSETLPMTWPEASAFRDRLLCTLTRGQGVELLDTLRRSLEDIWEQKARR